jgi:hypothetical protein
MSGQVGRAADIRFDKRHVWMLTAPCPAVPQHHVKRSANGDSTADHARQGRRNFGETATVQDEIRNWL